MLSFSKIVTLAAAAFGALSQAAPLNQRDAEHSLSVRASTPTPPEVIPTTLEGVLLDVRVRVDTAVKPLRRRHSHSGAAIKPIDDVLIGTGGVVLTVDAVLDLLCPILDVVFEALKEVLGLVADVSELLKILPIVIETIGCLLQAVCKITGVVFANEIVVKLQTVLQADLFVYVLDTLGSGPISL
ncbi:hypothetical protein BGW80DRAFT_1250979 [Lactifluus volemus]|nr:hypothetical protein BGW80DRAFT_1250979 [Lactifluus volemus]